ncbi:MAG: serine/threonine-protein kinase [Acidobacteria bacterium]|nr:serine/threonine-protein kinase [Acidobacteriota bacterium]
MNPDRWARIDQLLDEAMELPSVERSAYLNHACPDDEELRQEIESLLAAHERAQAKFLNAPALEIAAQQLAANKDRSLIGQMLGAYSVLSVLGVGGMGEVYLARDTRLNRKVALKLLPAQFTQDPARIKRFEREARAASALNHPNILTIYEIGQIENKHFIAAEYIEGRTLREVISSGQVTEKDAIEMTIQICSALSAAHAAGIVHRDIKPENIMLRSDGYVKVLDFGLVKLTEQERSAERTNPSETDPAKTNPGAVMGTARYMSPEQATGQNVDRRTDIFSLGVTFYELLVGLPPFKGDRMAAILDAIIHHQPVLPAQARRDLNSELDRIVARTLEKDRELRYQSAEDLRADLKRLQRLIDSVATSGISRHAANPGISTKAALKFSAKKIAVAAAAIVLIVAGLVWWMGWIGGKGVPELPDWKDSKFVEVTENQGIKSHPAISPDGQWIVYADKIKEHFDLFRQRVGGITVTNLTEGSLVDDWEPAVSPDGSQIAFRSERHGGGIFLMGATGENVRLLIPEGHNPAWSPDGNEIAYSTQFGGNIFNRVGVGSQIWIFNLKTNAKRHVAAGDDAVQPNWSPNGLRLAYWGLRKGAQRDIWTVAVAGGEPVAVTDDKAQDGSPIWAPDGRGLYYCSNRNGRLSLWRVQIDEHSGRLLGEAEPLQAPAFYGMMLSFSRDGKRIVYGNRIASSNIKRIGFNLQRGETTGESSWMTQSTKRATNQDISPDGQWLTYYIFGDPQFDIFVSKVGEPDKIFQITNDAHIDRAPRWSPDGKRIAFFSDQTGKYEIWTINPDGSDRRQMTFSREDQPGFLDPAWSRDGTRMLFAYRGGAGGFMMDLSRPYQEQELFMFPPPPDEQGRTYVGFSWSPDGNQVAGTVYDKNKEVTGIVLYDLKTQRYERLNNEGNGPTWLPDNRRLFYSFNYKIFLIDSQTRAVRELRFPAGELVDNPMPSADGKYLYYTADSNEESVWMISLK